MFYFLKDSTVISLYMFFFVLKGMDWVWHKTCYQFKHVLFQDSIVIILNAFLINLKGMDWVWHKTCYQYKYVLFKRQHSYQFKYVLFKSKGLGVV